MNKTVEVSLVPHLLKKKKKPGRNTVSHQNLARTSCPTEGGTGSLPIYLVSCVAVLSNCRVNGAKAARLGAKLGQPCSEPGSPCGSHTRASHSFL